MIVEPFYIAQTFDKEVMASSETLHAWLRDQAAKAGEQGGVCSRATIADDHTGVLYESWSVIPANYADHGPPRWSFAENETTEMSDG